MLANNETVLFDDWRIASKDLKLEKKIGGGGSSDVYKGYWKGTEVAIKVLRSDKIPQKARALLKKEAGIMVTLHHPNVVRLYGICFEEPYRFVIELMPENHSLWSVLRNAKKVLSQEERYFIAMDIVHGLAYLHRQGVIHCDLKSLNILLSSHFRAKIADFGLSKIMRDTTKSTSAVRGGTFAWMAPELLLGTGKNTKASDMYALAIVLFELVSGNEPWATLENRLQAPIKASAGEQEKYNPIPADCLEELSSIIRQCWVADAKKRLTIDVVAKRLEEAKSGERKTVEAVAKRSGEAKPTEHKQPARHSRSSNSSKFFSPAPDPAYPSVHSVDVDSKQQYPDPYTINDSQIKLAVKSEEKKTSDSVALEVKVSTGDEQQYTDDSRLVLNNVSEGDEKSKYLQHKDPITTVLFRLDAKEEKITYHFSGVEFKKEHDAWISSLEKAKLVKKSPLTTEMKKKYLTKIKDKWFFWSLNKNLSSLRKNIILAADCRLENVASVIRETKLATIKEKIKLSNLVFLLYADPALQESDVFLNQAFSKLDYWKNQRDLMFLIKNYSPKINNFSIDEQVYKRLRKNHKRMEQFYSEYLPCQAWVALTFILGLVLVSINLNDSATGWGIFFLVCCFPVSQFISCCMAKSSERLFCMPKKEFNEVREFLDFIEATFPGYVPSQKTLKYAHYHCSKKICTCLESMRKDQEIVRHYERKAFSV